jgi:hypothetical protein
VRQGDWKLIRDRGGNRSELFNLNDDPLEKNDLADQTPQRVRELSALLSQMAEQDR